MAAAVSAEGVPVITPVLVSIESPDGNAGVTDQLATAPPVLVGVNVGIATLVAKETVLGVYEIDGTTKVQVIETVVENPLAVKVKVSLPALPPM